MRISDWSSDVCSSDLPIRELALATNANRVLVDYLQTETYQSQPSIATLANAMDVGNPSNLERLEYLFGSFKHFKIGRASCRERVCQYVSISVVAGSLITKIISLLTY